MHVSPLSTRVASLFSLLVLGIAADTSFGELGAEISKLIEKYSIPTVAQYRAEQGFVALQHMYYSRTGLWRTCGWWNSANALTTVANMAKYDPEHEYVQSVAQRMFSETIVRAPKRNPQPGVEEPNRGKNDLFAYTKSIGPNGEYITSYPEDWWEDLGKEVPDNRTESEVQGAVFNAPNAGDWLDGYYDDDLWWALAWISAYDVTHDERYLRLSEGIFASVAKTWPSHCFNGGIYWSLRRDYVNAIANELFFSTAAHLANRTKKKKAHYIHWADRALKWFLGSGMINDEGTINDGLDRNCANNGRNTWSYNQGVIIGGLVELQKALPHPDSPYLVFASQIAHAALATLSDSNGIIHDVCEPDCGADGTQFKGIFMRNLQLLHEVAPDSAFADAVQRNAESIWEKNRADGGTIFSVIWSGPYVRPGNASTHSSAMDALVAALTVVRSDSLDTEKMEL